ncbi:MAG: hypothetical protein WBE18_02450 [Gammaproteobacteria bacterium]
MLNMFAVIYQFKLKPHHEVVYQTYWNKLVDYFIQKRGAIGSCLHKGENGLWVAYSRWPDKTTRDASWPGENALSEELPDDIRDIIQKMQALKVENHDLEQYDEICLDVVEDKLIQK